MNNEVRQKLRELIIEYGRSLCDDPHRCEALLKDYCGQHKREIYVLISALKNRVAEDLLKVSTGVPETILLARLNKRLEDELAMTVDAAHWAVESWALALDVIQQPLSIVKPTTFLPLPISHPIAVKVNPTLLAENLLVDRYHDNGNGTVNDVKTGLQWMRFCLGQKWINGTSVGKAKAYFWQLALDAAEALNYEDGYGTYLDWQVPTREQLQTLIYCSSGHPKIWKDTEELCKGNYERPTICKFVFPNTPTGWFWSSSSDYTYFIDGAWGVDFNDGLIAVCSDKMSDGYVRLVRSC